MKVYLYTFGCAFWGNQTPPAPLKRPWDLQISIVHLTDPHLQMPGTEPETQEKFRLENALELEEILAMIYTRILQNEERGFSETAVAINCVGGRARSVALAEIAAEELRIDGYHVEVVHLDIEKPLPERFDCVKQISQNPRGKDEKWEKD